jgi:hypothetical protein
VRLVKVALEGGEMEGLATSLLDRQRYGRERLKEMYGWRWGVETYVDRLKNIALLDDVVALFMDTGKDEEETLAE